MFFWSLPSLLTVFSGVSASRNVLESASDGFERPTRYMALGDSLAAGYGAVPATLGYVYLLYQSRIFDSLNRMLFCNAGVPGATSRDVLKHQVPLAIYKFRPTIITLSVGGNDLLPLLWRADLNRVLKSFQENLISIFRRLTMALPNLKIYMNNLYAIPQIPPTQVVVPAMNEIISSVANLFNVAVADVYGAFQGKSGLLLIEKQGAPHDEVHPSNAGYRVMAEAFQDIIRSR